VTVAVTAGYTDVYTRSYVRGRGWGRWVGTGIAAQPDLAAVSPAPGMFDLFWRGAQTEGFLKLASRRMTNGRWSTVTTHLVGDFLHVFANQRGNRTDLWAQGADGGMYHRTRISGTWGPWRRLPYQGLDGAG
jgi:hypothetical protein